MPKIQSSSESTWATFFNRIRAMIEYADVIYDNCPKCLADRLESVRMEAARICTGDRGKVVPKKLR